MNDTLFYNSFHFRPLAHHAYHHTDNTRHGIPIHFLARITCGTAKIVPLSGEAFSVAKGDVFLLPMGLRYHSYWYPDKDTQTVSWESYGFTYLPSQQSKAYLPQRISVNHRAQELLDSLAEHMAVDATGIGLLYLILGELEHTLIEVAPDPDRALLERASAYMRTHPNMSVGELAKHLGMSESAVYAFFSAYADTTPVAHKNRLMADVAEELLTTTDLSVEAISEAVGFSSVTYFRHILRQYKKQTPTQVRNSRHAPSLL